MILGAWWPIAVSRLNIGNAAGNDILTSVVEGIVTSGRASLSRPEALAAARANLAMGKKNTPLRYVVEALVEPWTRASSAPIYARQANAIVLDADWLAYLTANLPVVQGWVDHAWCMWVQDRNPNVPVSMQKLEPIDLRKSLSEQRSFFLRSVPPEQLHCAYTGALVQGPLHLDHFLPRSFVAHDRIWNLLPVAGSLNSAKGARIPDIRYVDALARFHAQVLRGAITNRDKSPFLEQYCLDLRLSPRQLGDADALQQAYSSVVPAMMTIASRMGFPSQWHPL
ncbi:HNH endonuclease [Devosia chinhatensis]|uniref:HNH endonuclease n=2 Tax=Devosia aurantiaca TaxID=2714858 RepID=A0A6M1SMI4_9HYPH|nr:HNH endonuclease [Devosia aurantiaca]